MSHIKWITWIPNVAQRGIWVPTRFVLRFFLHLRILGFENISHLQGGVIFALNHTSEMDVFVLPGSMPFLSHLLPVFYLARAGSWYKQSGWRRYFYGGNLFKIFGGYPAEAGQRNYEITLAPLLELLALRQNVCIFPEGHVTRDGTLQKGRGGVTYLAWKSGKPVVPVYVTGLWHLTLGDFFMRRRHAVITFGKPVPALELFVGTGNPVISETRNDFTTAAQTLMGRISGLKTP